MPTTLLLDGPDLEALLLRARREGGPNARITRAEKVRRGGVMGFFSREVFEVAVEVPDGYAPQPEPSQSQPGQSPSTRPAQNQDGAQPALGRGPAADDAFDAVVKAIAAMGTQDTRHTDLTALNAVGVSDSAARVRTAQRAATARAYSSAGGPPGPQTDAPTAESAAAGYAATALLDRLEGRGSDGPVPAQRTPVTHELAVDPVQPSTQQPAFTALLDQLRRETLPPAPDAPTPSSTDVTDVTPDSQGGQPGLAPVPHSVAEARIAAVFSPLVPAPAMSSEESVVQSVTAEDLAPAPLAIAAPAAPAAPAARRPADPQLKADRQVLRALGVPSKLTRRLRAGDRFDAVLAMCGAIPELDVDGDAPIVAIVGPSRPACFEAHRVAIDLATESTPRPILTLPAPTSAHRDTVLEASRRLDHAVVVVSTTDEETGEAAQLDSAKTDLRAVRAQVVVAIVDARRPLAQTRTWLAGLGRVDAVAVEHAADVDDPARVLELGLPVVRLDGVSMDPLGWTALLCARLSAAAGNA